MTDYKHDDYIKYRIELARETIEEVQSHRENKFWNTSINRMYYACFYAIGALLAKHKMPNNEITRQQKYFLNSNN
ncbi:MAG: HEPN domain-containing protein [Bacteroidetes bacterium]|nr:HEPN domain-containing protein [Bacteroidota bacterium]